MVKKLSIFSFIIICILLLPGVLAHAQSDTYLSIDAIDTTNFPLVKVYFSPLDHQGFPLPDLTEDNIALSEDGKVVDDFELAPIYQHPLQIVLVIDTSATMGFGEEPTPINNLIVTAEEFINSLSSDQFAVVTISNDANVIQDLTTDKNAVNWALDNLKAEGDSLLNDGMMEAILALEGNANRPVIILMIDGMDSGLSEYTLEEIADRLNQQRIPIYIISWRDANQNELEKLTALVHGDLQFLPEYFPDENAFRAAFNNLADSLIGARQQYLLSFTSNLPADGAEHEAVLAIDYLNRYAETARHFSAEPGIVSVTLLNLSDDQTVSGNVEIIPSVTAPTELDRIDILMDGTALANVLTPPFEYTWDSSMVDPGTHEFTLIATDRAGNKGQIDFSLTVEEPIAIQITAPLDGDTVSGSAMVLTEITSDLAVDRVEFFVDNRLLQTISSEPYGFEWDLAAVTAGSHEIKVSTTDIDGFSAEDTIFVEVVPNTPSYGVLIVVALAAAAILIPLGLRSRRKRTQKQLTGESIPSDSQRNFPSSEVGQAVLRELHGINPNQAWPLRGTDVKLGRKRSINDIPLLGLKASREQALIQYVEGQYVIYSLKPDNPILVNDSPIEKHTLQPGDLIRGGESTFRFEI